MLRSSIDGYGATTCDGGRERSTWSRTWRHLDLVEVQGVGERCWLREMTVCRLLLGRKVARVRVVRWNVKVGVLRVLLLGGGGDATRVGNGARDSGWRCAQPVPWSSVRVAVAVACRLVALSSVGVHRAKEASQLVDTFARVDAEGCPLVSVEVLHKRRALVSIRAARRLITRRTYPWRSAAPSLQVGSTECRYTRQTQVRQAWQVLKETVDGQDREVLAVREVNPFERGADEEGVYGVIGDVGDAHETDPLQSGKV